MEPQNNVHTAQLLISSVYYGTVNQKTFPTCQFKSFPRYRFQFTFSLQSLI